MPGDEYFYSVVLLCILGYSLWLYFYDATTKDNSTLLAPASTAAAFWLYFAAIASLLAFWLLVWGEHYVEHQKGLDTGFLHAVIHLPRVVFGWVANLSFFLAAISYAAGKQLDLRRLLRIALITTAAMALWALFWEIQGHNDNLFWTSLLIAPELAIATVAMVLLGWSFFVRWSGLFPTLYFAVTLIYALFQFPAFIELELDHFIAREHLNTLSVSFPLLATFQVLLSYGFLSLLRSSTACDVNMDETRYLFGGPRQVAKWAFPIEGGKAVRIAVDVAFGLLVAVLMYPVGEKLGPLLWRHFGL